MTVMVRWIVTFNRKMRKWVARPDTDADGFEPSPPLDRWEDALQYANWHADPLRDLLEA